jgi:hypothetical protein
VITYFLPPGSSISICLPKDFVFAACYIYFVYKSYRPCSRLFYPVFSRFIIKINFAAASLLYHHRLSPSLPRCLFGASSLICMINDSMLLNSNESSAPSSSSTLPLRSLQEILHNRIIQKKREMHPSHNRVYNDSLCTEIQTIQWVLAQILTLLRSSQAT